MKASERKLGNYLIRYNDDSQKALAFHTKFKETKKMFSGSNFMEEAEDWCRNRVAAKGKIVSAVSIDFNTDFMAMYEGNDFYFRMTNRNERIFIEMIKEKEENSFYARNKSTKNQNTICCHAKATPKRMKQFNLLPNARYALVETSTMNEYELIFDSVVMHKNDCYRLGIPGVGIYSY